MELALNINSKDRLTDTTYAIDKYFGLDIVNEIQLYKDSSSSKEDKQQADSLIKVVNSKYMEQKELLRKTINEQLVELNKRYLNNKNIINNDLDEKIKTIQENHESLSIQERAEKEHQKNYENFTNGEKTVSSRELIKLENEYEGEVISIKQQEVYLYQAKAELLASIKDKNISLVDIITTSILNFKSTFNFSKMIKSRRTWLNLMPIIMLTSLLTAHIVTCNITGYVLDFDSIITYGIYVAVVAVGAVFIYSQGSFDMSLGAAALMTAATTGLVFNATGNIYISLLMAIILGMMLGMVNAFLANFLRLPVMVMTLTMLNILSALFATIAESQPGGYVQVMDIRDYNSVALKWGLLITFTIFCFIVFNYTKMGRRNKMIGSNSTNAKFSGIPIMKVGIISFAMSGIGLGISGFLFTVQNGYVNTGTAIDVIGLNVIIAITLGGMPTSGGPRSKISAAIIGAFFVIILDEFFAAMSIANYRYLAKGLIYLMIVLVNSYDSRTKMLGGR